MYACGCGCDHGSPFGTTVDSMDVGFGKMEGKNNRIWTGLVVMDEMLSHPPRRDEVTK